MRIDGKTQFGMDQLDNAARKKHVEKHGSADVKADVASRTVSKADTVTISHNAKESVSLAKTLKDLPDVRNDKVAELKARIASGDYNVSGKDIAGKIIDTAVNGLF